MSELGGITTNLHTKPTDAQAYLHYTSDHPPCVKRAIPRGLGVRLKRICSDDTDYRHHRDRLANRLKERGYPEVEVNTELRRVDRIDREGLLAGRKSKRKSSDRVPMVLTFSSFLPDVRAIMKKNRHILSKSDRLKGIFKSDSMVAYKRGSNLKDVLVHKKTRRALGTRGRQDCGGDCVICRESSTKESLCLGYMAPCTTTGLLAAKLQIWCMGSGVTSARR